MLLQPLGVGAGGLPDASPRLDPRDAYARPCYEQSALMRQYDVLAEICGYCEQLGWNPYQADHEDANGQFEVNWKYAEALLTADRVAFHKFMVRAVAERHGLRVTFMPKPLETKTGNGMHMHVTLHSSRDGGAEANVFADKASADPMRLSAIAHTFLGGMMAHVRGLCAFACPTVNSYKRLGAASPDSGATWAPTVASHGGNDRTHVVRVPDAPRFELRLADMASNPYLLPAATLAAGLRGMDANLQPGPRASVPAWRLPRDEARLLPTNLLEAVEALEADGALCEALGAEMCAGYAQLRRKQWRDYSMHLTQWELDTYLDL
jgi:glutamine synthetase